jgi:cobalt-zinc-cadmium efflux system outer membrane protein
MKRFPGAFAGRIFLILAAAIPGCILAPQGLKAQQSALATAGALYTRPVARREMPYVPFQPTWQEVLRRAFLADGDLEIAYDQWAQAIARVDEMGAYPNTPVSVGFSYLFSPDKMTAWDHTTLSAGPDPQTDLLFPTKVSQSARIALDEARAAAKRFAAAKFALQRRVLVAYFDLVLMDQKIRLQEENVELLRSLEQETSARVQTGGTQRDLLKAQLDRQLAENDLAAMESEHDGMITSLNAMMGRNVSAAILPPPQLPPPRPLPADDGTLLTIAVDNNPELAALAEETRGRQDALELARMAYIPDINPAAAITGTLTQSVGAVVILPFTTPKALAPVKEAQAAILESQALARQTTLDRAGTFVTTLLALRDDERAADLLSMDVLPRAQEALTEWRDAYSAGSASFSDLIDSQRTLLNVRTMVLESRMDREKRLAQLEELAGLDLGTLKPLPFYDQKPQPAKLHNTGKKPASVTQPSPGEIFIQ